MFDRNTLLEEVLLEATLSNIAIKKRAFRGVQIEPALQRLCSAWVNAPGPANMSEKIQAYRELGMVGRDAMPFVPTIIRGRPEPLEWIKSVTKKSTTKETQNEDRDAWLKYWLQWLDRVWYRFPLFLKKKRLGIVDRFVHLDWDTGTMALRSEIGDELALLKPSGKLPIWAVKPCSQSDIGETTPPWQSEDRPGIEP